MRAQDDAYLKLGKDRDNVASRGDDEDSCDEDGNSLMPMEEADEHADRMMLDDDDDDDDDSMIGHDRDNASSREGGAEGCDEDGDSLMPMHDAGGDADEAMADVDRDDDDNDDDDDCDQDQVQEAAAPSGEALGANSAAPARHAKPMKVVPVQMEPDLVNEYEEFNLSIAGSYPHLFPKGVDDTFKRGIFQVNLRRRLLLDYSGQFERDRNFIFTLFGMKQRHNVNNATGLAAKKAPATFKQFKDYMQNPKSRESLEYAKANPKSKEAAEV